MFSCERCGACCRSIVGVFLAKDMVLPNGVCKFFDENNSLCEIYSTRPIFCNVDAFYNQFLSEKIDRQKFYEQVKAACKKLRNKNFVIDKPLRRVITANELPKNLNWRSGDQCNDYKYQ